MKNELTKQQTDSNPHMHGDLSIGTPPIASSTFSIRGGKIFAPLGQLQEARLKFHTNTTVDQSEIPDIERSPVSQKQAMIPNPFAKLFSGAGLQAAKRRSSLQMTIGAGGVLGLQDGPLSGKKKSLFDIKDLKSIYNPKATILARTPERKQSLIGKLLFDRLGLHPEQQEQMKEISEMNPNIASTQTLCGEESPSKVHKQNKGGHVDFGKMARRLLTLNEN